MIGATLLIGILAQASLLQVQTVPWTPGRATCFPADLDLDGAAELCVLADMRLRVYGKRKTEPLLDLVFPEGTSAIDLADIDHDGECEVVAIQNDAVLSFDIGDSSNPEAKTLFLQKNQYSHATGRPFPCVLVVDREGTPMVAMPQNDMLEVRSLTGDLVESYPVGVRTPNHLSINRPFSYWVNQHAQAGPNQALEFRISSVVSFRPLRTGEQAQVDIESPLDRIGTPRQQREAATQAPEDWPWFTVGIQGETQVRAMYGANAESGTTAICIRSMPLEGTAGEVRIGPPRHYPGALILKNGVAPDFNHDGFTDIVLWKSRQPSMTASSLSKAASSRKWPITITSHVYLPEKQRFEPVPNGHITMDIPVAWWMLPSPHGPLRNVLLRDFNGDGLTDFGCFSDARTLTIWTSSKDGFGAAPALVHEFPGENCSIQMEADLEGLGNTTLAIESGESLHILRPWSPVANF